MAARSVLGVVVSVSAVGGEGGVSVALGSWYKLSAAGGWRFRPGAAFDHVELALYDVAEDLEAGTTPFPRSAVRRSGGWPDGPENAAGDLGYEAQPNVLGDSNSSPYGKADYRCLRLYGRLLSSATDYQLSFDGTVPSHVWIHPLRASCFTLSAAALQSSESTLQSPAYGPASVTRTAIDATRTRFQYTGLQSGSGTGLKDDYPVADHGQRLPSHGNGDFLWFSGYSLHFENEGPGAVFAALFINTGFTGTSGAPSNDPRNNTYWKSAETLLSSGEATVVWLDFEDVEGWGLSDNPFPHTAGGQSVPDGTRGADINVFDRLQVSAIGWEVRSATGGTTNASLVLTPLELAPYAAPSFQRAEVNGDGVVDATDGVYILDFLFRRGPPPDCRAAADVNDDGRLNIVDPVYVFAYLFRGVGPVPPPSGGCGKDLTPDGLECTEAGGCP
ncbi:MAG: hypothetical protein HY721_32885 [Planctomycetes bacterium]|nr:hypothetical protein [Planctomycetota bacterium]